jgi:signal transduction histidine kinase
VFDAFYRGDGSSSLGLGLALVERIARAHGGRAWAENRADGGASVHFEIPRETRA